MLNFRLLIILVSSTAIAGCGQTAKTILPSTWHQKCGWKAEEFFDDPQVIALCQAIEKSDIAEIDRLVNLGADVNAKGKGNMTPLLWAFPDNNLARFKRVLEHGANPNIVIASDFNTRGGMSSGDSVTHLACKTAFPGYFNAVFAHGGDTNLIKNGLISNQTPLFTVITGASHDKQEQVKLLIEKGANLNQLDGADSTPLEVAIGRGFYNLALQLVEAGADYKRRQRTGTWRTIHLVVLEERRSPQWVPEQREAYQKLVAWFEEHGESVAAARPGMKRVTRNGN